MTNRPSLVNFPEKELTEYPKRIAKIASIENDYHLRDRLNKVNKLFHQKIQTAQKLEENWESQEYREKIVRIDDEIKELLFLTNSP